MLRLRSRRASAGSSRPLRLAGVLAILLTWGLLDSGCDRPPAEEPRRESDEIRRQLTELTSQDRPNVVLVTIDTLRADHLSSFGSDVETPHLDRLAADGTLFTNASTTVPFTFPAHSSILTGTYPPFHGVRENVGYHLGEEPATLAEMLGEAGYQTAGFVSAFVLDSRWGLARGFEHFFDDFDLGAFEKPNLASVQRPGTETIAAAVDWLDGRERDASDDRPFFVWLHLYDPHDPYTPPEPFRSQYPGRPYAAEVAFTDSLVGGFVGELETRGLLEESVVVVTSDHGEGLGDHDEAFHGFFVYDSTVHVPLILRLPGRLAAGKKIEQAASHVDIVPTILDLLGLEIPGQVQGRSLFETDYGSEPVVYTESFYPLLHYGWAPLRVLRSSAYKYIEAPERELFDLTIDPEESLNLADKDRAVTARMARTLIAMADELAEGAETSEEPDLDEQTLAQLQALGYLAGPGRERPEGYDPFVPRSDPKDKVHLHRTIMRAQSRIGDGEPEAAAYLLEEALTEDPELLDAHQMLGDIELRAERPEVASHHFERALALDDRHRPSLFGLATSHRLLGKTDEALLGYHRLLDVAGQDSKATIAIADIEVDRGRLDAAEQALQQAAQPGAQPVIFNRLGEVQALAGKATEARKSFEQAIESNPEASQPHFNLAILHEEAGNVVEARQQYEEAIRLGPKHYQAQFNLARLMGRLGDPDRERELLEASIESKSDFALGHFFLGKALMDGGELEQAEVITRIGLEINDENQLGWFVLADILNRRGRREEADQAVARGRSLSPVTGGS